MPLKVFLGFKNLYKYISHYRDNKIHLKSLLYFLCWESNSGSFCSQAGACLTEPYPQPSIKTVTLINTYGFKNLT